MLESDYNGYKVRLVENLQDLKVMCSHIHPKIKVGVDTETNGLTYAPNSVAGVCISCGRSYHPSEYAGYYIPLRHINYENNLPIPKVMKVVQNIVDKCVTVWWNRNFDLSMLEYDGLKVPYIGHMQDGQIMAHLAFSESYPALKDTTQKMLKFKVLEFSSNKAENNNFMTTDPRVSYIYASQDPLTTVLTSQKIWNDYPYIRKIYPLDNKVLEAVRRLSATEIFLDFKFLKGILGEEQAKLRRYREECIEIAGYPFNVNSSQEKADALCFSEDTEFLTEKGFMKYDDITSEKIAQLNETTKEVEFVIPEGRISRTSKEMYHINHRYTDLFVTPGHKMYVALDKDDYKLLSINDIVDKKRGFRVKNTVNTVGVERTEPFIFESRKGATRYKKLVIPADTFIEFLGFWYGDGHSTISSYKKKNGSVHTTYKVGFTQSTCKEKADTVKWLLELNQRMGNIFGVSKRAERYDFQCAFKVFAEYMENCCKVNKVKTIPLWIRDLSVRQRRLFLDGYLRADGTFNGVNVFLSSNLEMLKELRFLSVISGRKCSNIRLKTEEGSVTSVKGVELKHDSKPIYTFSSTIRFDYSHITPNDIEFVEDYNGRVVCFQVPSSILVVRRKGKVSVCGNCRFVTLTKKTASGKWKVDDETLSTIDHPLAAALVRYSKQRTYMSSFLEKMCKFDDGEPIRVNYSSVNVATGRLSSGGAGNNKFFRSINGQNIPKVEVKGYIHPSEEFGYIVNEDPHNCVSENTIVPTLKGEKKISLINEGDEVLSSKGYQKVIKKWTSKKPVMRINLQDGKFIECSPEHRIKVIRNSMKLWVPAVCILPTDHIVTVDE